MLLEVPTAVEAGGAKVAGKGPLARVNDDVSGELRATLFVFAAELADEALGGTLPVGVDDLTMPFQVADASEAAAAQVAAERSDAAVDERMTRQQRPELESFATERADEGVCALGSLLARDRGGLGFDTKVDADVMLLQAGGSLEAAEADAAAVRLVGRMQAGVSGEQRLRFQTLPTNMAGKRDVGERVFLAAASVAVDQDLVAGQLVMAGKFAATDITQVRPLARVGLEVDGKLGLAPELFATEVTKKHAGPLRLGGAVHVDHLLVVLQVIGPHVGFGAEVTAVRLHARVNDLVRFQA